VKGSPYLKFLKYSIFEIYNFKIFDKINQ